MLLVHCFAHHASCVSKGGRSRAGRTLHCCCSGMDCIPRTLSRAQTFDSLSSMANIAGYR